MLDLKSIIENSGVLDTLEENEESIHRVSNSIERPSEEVVLKALADEVKEYVKTQKDPTDDLVWIPNGLTEEELYPLLQDMGYLVWCGDTAQTWYAATDLILNKNFIYRDDLVIDAFESKDAAWSSYETKGHMANPGIHTRKTCYILDNPANETYEVFYDATYPSRQYGQSTPKGCFVHKYLNRFHRDMAILQLDDLYGNSSAHDASKLIASQLKSNQAIIVSDGAYMKDSISSAFYYIDNDSVIKFVEGTLPSEETQAVLISEINGAFRALEICQMRGKTDIFYYYDNTSILNVFKNRKTEYIEEIRRYKSLCNQFVAMGIKVRFMEIHPKTGEDRTHENKALMFFHNSCDAECRVMSDIYKKNYKVHATLGERTGTNLKDAAAKTKPKNFNGGYKGGGKRY